MIAIVLTILIFIFLVGNFLVLAMKNHRAHQFLRLKAPELPVLLNPRMFSGHIFEVILQDKNYKIISSLHKSFGSTFGFYFGNQAWVSTTDLDTIKLIELDQPHKHINRSTLINPSEEFHNSIFQVIDDEWRKVRKVVGLALTGQKVRGNEVICSINDAIMKMTIALRKKIVEASKKNQNSVIIDVEDLMERYAVAIMFSILYKRNDIDFEAKEDHWTSLLRKVARDAKHPVNYYTAMFPFLQPIVSFIAKFRQDGQAQAYLVDFVTAAIDSNLGAREVHTKVQRRVSMETGAKVRDFCELKRQGDFKRATIDDLIDSYFDKKINYETLMGTGTFLMLAGFEKIATTLTGLMWHLVQDLKFQEKLREVIANEGIDSAYVTSTLYETIRLIPAVVLGTGRVLGEDILVNGTFLPKGTHVMPSTYTIHMDPNVWPEPEKFIPDRFMGSDERHPAAFMGFGLGPRNCVGAKLALQAMKTLLQFLLLNYRFEACEETPGKFEFSASGLLWVNLDRPVKVRMMSLK